MAQSATETKTTSTPLADMLRMQVANLSVMYMKLHHYHWYVKGEQFFTLHIKFEELYNETALVMDQVAERMLAVGLKPVSTMKQCLQLSSIKEAAGTEDAQEMVKQLLKDFSRMREETNEAIQAASEQEDEGTADLLTDMLKSLDKHMWMLNAYVS